jgi:hypothetical protein
MKPQGSPHKNPKSGPFFGVFNDVAIPKTYFSTIHFNITVPSVVQIPKSKVILCDINTK